MRCPACDRADLESFFELPDVPVLCNRLWPTEDEARRAPRGRIDLGFCRACGMIHNAAFDPARLHYDRSYENSLHFSPRFQEYAEELVAGLVERHALVRKDVVEIGSGKGDFLRMLCERGGNRGVGFDHSHEGPERVEGPGWSVRFVHDYYGPAHADLPVDLVCCRHVLEHIDRPAGFLRDVRAVAGGRGRALAFFEVPNALFTLRDLGVWDVIYEHCSYFAAPALTRLFEATGWSVLATREVFGSQFLCLEAETAEPGARGGAAPDPGALLPLVRDFASHFRAKVADWRARLDDLAGAGRRVAIWGAGSKGVTFLNTVDSDRRVVCAVDINPRKQERFLPGTGQPVVAPEAAVERGVDFVLVMNPLYVAEIESRLRSLGSGAAVAAV